MAETNRPVVIRRVKKAGSEPHHGGAWKVAYADFVTAMMAFFLLMWLMNATTERQRKGLSDYFNPTVPINRISGGGDGALDGGSLFSEEQKAHNGAGGTAHEAGGTGIANADQSEADGQIEQVLIVEQALFERGGESRTMEQMLRHVVTRVTDEGLVIELFDLDNASLFEGDTADPAPVTLALARLLGEVLDLVGNKIAVNGHLRRESLPLADPPGWELSMARAAVLRSLLQQSGLSSERFRRVTGYSHTKPASSDLTALRNNRIEIVLLRRDR